MIHPLCAVLVLARIPAQLVSPRHIHSHIETAGNTSSTSQLQLAAQTLGELPAVSQLPRPFARLSSGDIHHPDLSSLLINFWLHFSSFTSSRFPSHPLQHPRRHHPSITARTINTTPSPSSARQDPTAWVLWLPICGSQSSHCRNHNPHNRLSPLVLPNRPIYFSELPTLQTGTRNNGSASSLHRLTNLSSFDVQL